MFPVSQIDSSAKGMQSGMESRMVKGWTRFSNWEARIMYMKTIERANAQPNSLNVRSSSRPFPETRVVYAAGRFIEATAARSASSRSANANPGATDARRRTSRCRSRRSIRDALGTRSIRATLSSRATPPPSRATRSLPIVPGSARSSSRSRSATL